MALRYTGVRLGKVRVAQEYNGETVKYDVDIRQGNCLAVLVYVRKATKEELEKNPKGKWFHQLWSFFGDEQHMKNIMKDGGDVFFGEDIRKIELNMYYKECKTLLKYFLMSGHKVECYYEEPKEK